MKTIINKFNLKILFILSVSSFVFSCRYIPENEKYHNENISLGKPVLVNINFLGIEYENYFPQNTFMSGNNTWGGVIL